MLTELRILNFAIIDRLELNFTSGLITFTGETGAGKSIIIDAVETVIGGRADANLIRTEADRAVIEATFQIPPALSPHLIEILEREELLDSSETVTLGREIRRSGRSVARVNGRSVNTGLLDELGSYLVDIHGQSEHLSLLRVRQHIKLLDNFASLDDQLEEYRNVYRKLQSVRKELERLRQSESEAARRADLLTYQIQEIDGARLKPGEEEELKDERNRLANAESLAELAAGALLALDEGTPEAPSITDMLGEVTRSLTALARLDPTQNELDEQAGLLFENLAELSRSLRDYHENIEFNPQRLDQVEERLNLLQTLKRKYGPDIQSIIAFADQARHDLEEISHSEERIEQLQIEEKELLADLSRTGQQLSHLRHEAAIRLSKAIEEELSDLHMEAAQFRVDLNQRLDPKGVELDSGERVAFDGSGLEQVEFMVAPNPGEGFKPLVKIASGGETSRLMLALKNVLASADQTPTLIFDEIDQGIGGRVGTVVGKKLWTLARKHQVLCITHLPQLAAYGEQHYRVEKQVEEGRTSTVVSEVKGQDRLDELAQMMGGISEGTRRSAHELLQSVTLVAK
jgi:DNA repair protein RecN (Recombination protein N)